MMRQTAAIACSLREKLYSPTAKTPWTLCSIDRNPELREWLLLARVRVGASALQGHGAAGLVIAAGKPVGRLQQVGEIGGTMAEPKQIPPKLADAFFDAVRAYIRWAFAAPMPTITVDQAEIPISIVCERVAIFTDPIPWETFNALFFVASTQKPLREKLGADRSYATGALCLLKLIEDRQAEWREEWRRTQ